MTRRSLLASALLTFCLPSANAENMAQPDWANLLPGLDGITITCANANEEKYAARICDEMLERINARFEPAKIPVAVLGSYFSKTEDAPAKPDTMATPLRLTVHVRGTNSGNVYAINLRNDISVAYENAVEASRNGESIKGRKGNLVLWQVSTTGSGPRNQLTSAIASASLRKLEVQIDEIIRNWPK